jgi:hypothetical protein
VPFFGKFSCFSFTYASVRQNAPRQCGVYAISNAREWLFVGAADDVQLALHNHLLETATPLKSNSPTGFTFELCDPAARQSLLDKLLIELRPTCNRPHDPPRKHSVKQLAK